MTAAAHGFPTVLADPALQRLWQSARERFEALGGPRGTAVVRQPSDGERLAIRLVLGGRPLPPGDLRVRLEALDVALRRSSAGLELRDLLVHFGGPLRNIPAEREQARAYDAAVWAAVDGHCALARHGDLAGWVDDLRLRGTLKRLAPGRETAVLRSALDVLAALPADSEPLAVLAARVCGDSHALDRGSAVGSLVVTALSRMRATPGVTAEQRRALWASAGVACDAVSTDVLVLNLALAGGGVLARALQPLVEAGQPARITLRQLLADEGPVGPRVIHVCENPSVIEAAAERMGAESPALLCTEGRPTSATTLLLRRAVAAGATVRFHCDFDWSGIAIGNALLRSHGCQPWHFSAADYRAAVAALSVADSLAGKPEQCLWDAGLTEEMQRTGLIVYEEHVLELLLSDLAASTVQRPGSRLGP